MPFHREIFKPLLNNLISILMLSVADLGSLQQIHNPLQNLPNKTFKWRKRDLKVFFDECLLVLVLRCAGPGCNAQHLGGCVDAPGYFAAQEPSCGRPICRCGTGETLAALFRWHTHTYPNQSVLQRVETSKWKRKAERNRRVQRENGGKHDESAKGWREKKEWGVKMEEDVLDRCWEGRRQLRIWRWRQMQWEASSLCLYVWLGVPAAYDRLGQRQGEQSACFRSDGCGRKS